VLVWTDRAERRQREGEFGGAGWQEVGIYGYGGCVPIEVDGSKGGTKMGVFGDGAGGPGLGGKDDCVLV
jgi:hypothetical protein